MKLTEAIQVLEDHITWRKGSETPSTDITQLTRALEYAIDVLKRKKMLKLRIISFIICYVIQMIILFIVQKFYKPIDWIWAIYGIIFYLILYIRYVIICDKNKQ